MELEREKYRNDSLSLCLKLLRDLEKNKIDAGQMLGGEACCAYVNITEKVIDKVQKCRKKIQNL